MSSHLSSSVFSSVLVCPHPSLVCPDAPRVQRLAAGCSWTLRTAGPDAGQPVSLPSYALNTLADQVCKDLGCGGVYRVDRTPPPPGAACLRHCTLRGRHLINCTRDAAGRCPALDQVVCGDQQVRLAGGPDRCAGRVEVWRDGQWGTVCDDQWDLRDGGVACGQLGCGFALSVTGQGGAFPPGRGPVHLDELGCSGREPNLWACPAAHNQSDCGHKEDAGVVCSEMRAIRLTGGLDRCSGKVEIHRNGSWGELCDNCWDEDMASMVCSLLNCGETPQKYTAFLPPFSRNEETPFYYYSCGKDQSLWQCEEHINHPYYCISSKPSGVICNEAWTRLVPAAAAGPSFPSLELLSCMVLSVVLLVFLIINTVLCCLYRRRNAFLLQQTRNNQSRPSTGRPQNDHKEAVNLVKVTAHPQHADVPSDPRYLWTQLSSADSGSVDTDYEQYGPSYDPPVPLSTFRNSQRYKTEVLPLKPSGLDSLCEESPNRPNEAFKNLNGVPEPTYSRVSKISEDSFDSSSTSSGESYENLNANYVNFTPDAGAELGAFSYPPPPEALLLAGAPDGSDDDYSPVSPD
ncbi:unnamed protein product [Menidia menidia]|uniref:(Atlantic silverside) hypothetical protein n=1 Tax=Menidia menidia TaxID=238744 RepID=A0A8S4BDJ3_9TELE|nr:unnamed protein product [Menidia menidia]